MQHFFTFEIPAEARPLFFKDHVRSLSELLHANEPGLMLMLQGYHPREKVRSVQVEEASLQLLEENNFIVRVKYTVEEFNVCSNIDDAGTESMTLSLITGEGSGEVTVKGAYWPEREPDSL